MKITVKIKDPEPEINLKLQGWENICAINVLLQNFDIVKTLRMSEVFAVTEEIDSLIYINDRIGMKEELRDKLSFLLNNDKKEKNKFALCPSEVITQEGEE